MASCTNASRQWTPALALGTPVDPRPGMWNQKAGPMHPAAHIRSYAYYAPLAGTRATPDLGWKNCNLGNLSATDWRAEQSRRLMFGKHFPRDTRSSANRRGTSAGMSIPPKRREGASANYSTWQACVDARCGTGVQPGGFITHDYWKGYCTPDPTPEGGSTGTGRMPVCGSCLTTETGLAPFGYFTSSPDWIPCNKYVASLRDPWAPPPPDPNWRACINDFCSGFGRSHCLGSPASACGQCNGDSSCQSYVSGLPRQ